MPETSEKSLLRIDRLSVRFTIREGLLHQRRVTVKAVSGVSLALNRGDVLGLVGESGCGKTTLGRAIVGLAPVTSGRIDFDGQNIVGLTGRKARERAQRIQLIFQDPYSSLHPRKTVRDAVGVGLKLHGLAKGLDIDEQVLTMLKRVGFSFDHMYRY
ncbi:MAG: ATP-binding cassette domain-containing protein, partial [Desulfobacterales bacterium]|nr:ATP-binding cassette domain-containing protein [Desulfobacterales bacterium]